ncbi:MAG: cryptochrome/photolyase family protein [Pseudomonadota bacterium]|jgi:deoxyribodipyrimidine photolyase-related protein
MKTKKRILRLILGDQLNGSHSWFNDSPGDATYLLMEVRAESEYAPHHIQKVVAFFASMRAFASELRERGFTVLYISLLDSDNSQSLEANIERLMASGEYCAFEYQQPDEYRVAKNLNQATKKIKHPVRIVSTEHFMVEPEFFTDVFKGHKRYVMESFYRAVRSRYNLLMEDGKPLGGRWNFDSENRNKLPKDLNPPPPLTFSHDVQELVAIIKKAGIKTIGTIDDRTFSWPVCRSEALKVLNYFCKHLLPDFGSYQDAMHTEHPFLFHSRLSFSLNVKHISPLEVVKAAISAFESSEGAISLSQVEGFVRQIIGWREFMRGVYWAHMPKYKTLNVLGADRKLPHFFWDGKTKMNCVHHAVNQSLTYGYAHHIQRLMVTGNFAIMAGIAPSEINEWYLGIYIDAIEWVQLPNTHGMSQFADGGIVGTKPYHSSAQYINKMSNYCGSCFYRYKERVGDKACPFNSLYWDFLMRHEDQLSSNPRIGMGYQLLKKMSAKDKQELAAQAKSVLERIEEL